MKKIPKKIIILLHPAIVNLPSGRYLVINSSNTDDGWYEVDDSFTIEKALKLWEKKSTTQVSKPANDWVWKVENSKKNGYYTVTFDKAGWSCDCTGFGFRRKCRHIDEAKTKMN